MKRVSHADDYQQAYIYAFPMIAAYKAMYQFNVDKTNSQYKGTVQHRGEFVPGLHAERHRYRHPQQRHALFHAGGRSPRRTNWCFCVPDVPKNRYYSVQLTDMYTFNYGYVGSRATGNEAGCYMVTGPGWKGVTPKGVSRVFQSETQFSLLIYRTQLFNAADIDNVKKIQAGYTVQPLSAYLHQPAPPPRATHRLSQVHRGRI